MTSAQAGPASPGRVLGVDVGAVRVGLAVSDETRTLASPLVTLPRQAGDLWPSVRRHLSEQAVTEVVVGLPRRLDGSEGEAAADARAFTERLGHEARLPVHLWDERFTTALAERYMVSAGVRRRRRRQSIDSVAAALTLQTWLDAQRSAG